MAYAGPKHFLAHPMTVHLTLEDATSELVAEFVLIIG